jgi:hypothetical protein
MSHDEECFVFGYVMNERVKGIIELVFPFRSKYQRRDVGAYKSNKYRILAILRARGLSVSSIRAL